MTSPSFPLSGQDLNQFVHAALAEDLGSGDVTCSSVIPLSASLNADMIVREPMVACGLPIAQAIFTALDETVTIEDCAEDGTRLVAGGRLMRIKGNARAMLSAERTALNIVQHLSGIATFTRQFVDAVDGTGATILDTRKTVPLLRRLAKYATACGGAQNHRMGLYDAVMIKDNHIALVGSIKSAIAAAKAQTNLAVQVECDDLEQLQEALDAGADSVLLDNMSTNMLRDAVALIDGRIPCEASGGVRLETVRDIALTGVDFISVGRLTQSAPAIDIGLDFGG